MNLGYIDADDMLDIVLWTCAFLLIIEWFAQTGSDSSGYTAAARGDGPVMLTDRALDHLDDGGTIDVERWHGGTLTIEGYQTVDVGGGESGG